MEGVTTAIVGFIFVCLVYPHLVKSRPQFYAALGLVLIVILLDAVGNMSSPDSTGANPLHHVMYVLAALVQILTIIVMVMCVGGLSVRELAGEVSNSVEVMRRGTDKPVLVPLTGEQPKAREDKAEAPQPPRRPARPKDKDDAAIPLD